MTEITITFPRDARIGYDRPEHDLTIVVPPHSKIKTAEQLKWALLNAHKLDNRGAVGDADALRSLFGMHLAGESRWEIFHFFDHTEIDALMLRACRKLWKIDA